MNGIDWENSISRFEQHEDCRHMSEGYNFYTNFSDDQEDNWVAVLNKLGISYVINSIALDIRGNSYAGGKALFLKHDTDRSGIMDEMDLYERENFFSNGYAVNLLKESLSFTGQQVKDWCLYQRDNNEQFCEEAIKVLDQCFYKSEIEIDMNTYYYVILTKDGYVMRQDSFIKYRS